MANSAGMQALEEITTLYSQKKITYAEYLRRRAVAQAQKDQEDHDKKDQQALLQMQSYLAGAGRSTCAEPAKMAQLVTSEAALMAENRRKREEENARKIAEAARRSQEIEVLEQKQRAADKLKAASGKTSAQIAAAAATQREVNKAADAIAQSQYQRLQTEKYRAQVMEAPLDWQSLPAEEQGIAIATELADRRQQVAAALGETITDTRPAYQIAPVQIGAPLPYYGGYTPAATPTVADIVAAGPPTGPVIDVGTWPYGGSYGAGTPDANPGGTGGCGGGTCSAGKAGSGSAPYSGATPYIDDGASVGGVGTPPTYVYTPAPTTPTTPATGGAGGDAAVNGNFLDTLQGFLDFIQEGGRIDVGPGLSSVSATTGSRAFPSWAIWVAVGLGVFLLIKLFR